MQRSEVISAFKQQLKFNCHNNSRSPLGIYGGEFGSVILLYCLSKQDGSFDDIAEQKLDSVLKQLPRSTSMPTICNGIAGVGFGLILLDNQGYISLEKDSLQTLDSVLLNALITDLSINNFDYLHGACGIMKYFIESYPYNRLEVQTAIDYWLNALLNNSYQTVNSIRLSFKQIQGHGYNISLSHGLSSIIVILAELKRLDLSISEKIVIEKLLRGYTDYILSKIDNNHSLGSFTPIFADKPFTKSRLAWCYGDLGIALALWKAADALNDTVLKKSALDIFKFSAVSRRDNPDTNVNDACICHGSSGIGQCFKWLYSQTNCPEFHDAYNYWLERTLEYAVDNSGFVHYPFYNMSSNSYKPKDSILEGDPGVLLFLLNEDNILNKILLYE